MSRTATDEWVRDTARLVDQRRRHTGESCKWADYEVRAVTGEGGFEHEATFALGFQYEFFGMRDSCAVSCEVCGGLFRESLSVMRRHRLRCGWS
jgi:hypothetical protein